LGDIQLLSDNGRMSLAPRSEGDRQVSHARAVQRAKDLTSHPPRRNELGGAKFAQMPRCQRLADTQRLGQVGNGDLTVVVSQILYDAQPCCVRQGTQGGT
jgi:hypothetical protein